MAKSYGKPTEILRKHAEASACFRMLPHASAEKLEKVRKLIEFHPAEAIFTVRKPCGSRAEAMRKSYGSHAEGFFENQT